MTSNLHHTVTEPERSDTEDAYLRCVKCGHMLPILHTPADEPCDMCGGFMADAIGEWSE